MLCEFGEIRLLFDFVVSSALLKSAIKTARFKREQIHVSSAGAAAHIHITALTHSIIAQYKNACGKNACVVLPKNGPCQ